MKIKHMEIQSKCQICSCITLLSSGLKPQKIAVILKICVAFGARHIFPSIPCLAILAALVLYIRNGILILKIISKYLPVG